MNMSQKRSFVSPTKTQTSIVAFTSGNKRTNSNKTPTRSPIARAQEAILGPPSRKNKLLGNNPFGLLAEEDDEMHEDDTCESYSDSTQVTTNSVMSPRNDSSSTPLSNKARRAAEKLKKSKAVLMDNSLRLELEQLTSFGGHKTPEVSERDKEEPFSRKNETSISLDDNKARRHEATDLENLCVSSMDFIKPTPSVPQTRNGRNSNVNNASDKEATRSNVKSPTIFSKPVLTSIQSTPRAGNQQAKPETIKVSSVPKNPYIRTTHKVGTGHPKTINTSIPRADKVIDLEKGMIRPYIHRYTLRLKIIKSRSEEEEQQLIQATLQKIFDIVLQANCKTIIPPFLELDRNDKSVPDLSSAFQVSAVDSFYSHKKYFFRMSPRDEAGIIWCSIILAQSTSFSIFMEKGKYSLDNQAFSLWPKASDNETATDLGWCLYSTRQQDKDRLASLLTTSTNENIGVKWKPIRTTNGPNRKKDPADSSERVYALHVECASDRVQETKKKLVVWYDSSSSTFPDGTKMRLVPLFSSVLSMNNRTKFASCLARQAALSAGLGTCTTWEMSTNLMLDKIDPEDHLGS